MEAVKAVEAMQAMVGGGSLFGAESRQHLRTHGDRERLLAAAYRAASVQMAMVDPAGIIIDVNAAFCRFLGREQAALLGTPMREVIAPGDRAADELLRSRLAAGTIDHYDIETRYLRGDGSIAWGQLAVEPAILLEDAGHPLAWGAWMRLGAAMHAAGEAEAGVAVIRGVLAGMEQAGNLFDQPEPMLQLGISLTDLGRIDEARSVYRRMIALCQRHGFDHALFRAFMGFAEAAMRNPSPYTARVGALVCGAAQAMSVRSGLPQVSWWESRLEAARIAAGTMLGEDPVAVLIAEGRATPAPGAARLALGR